MAYHGNLQKIRNGKRTFAITPHIPGGFIDVYKRQARLFLDLII